MESIRPIAGFIKVKEAAQTFHVELKQYSAGAAFDFGGVSVRVLNPQPGWQSRPRMEDDESLVLRMQYGETSALLVGDAHQRIEKFLIDRIAAGRPAESRPPRQRDVQFS